MEPQSTAERLVRVKRRHDGDDEKGATVTETQQCQTCKVVKPLNSFSKDAAISGGQGRRCRLCESKRAQTYQQTVSGALHTLLEHAKSRAKERAKLGRGLAGECTLTYEELRIIYDRQEGRCVFTGKIMSFTPHARWRISLDRIDPEKGYTKENVRLVAMELNVTRTWTWAHVREMLQLRSSPNIDVDYIIASIMKHDRQRWPVPVIGGETCKAAGHTEKHRNGRCADCQRLYMRARAISPYGFVQRMVNNSILLKKNSGGIRPAYTRRQIADAVGRQQGRCDVSSVPLTFMSNTPWSASARIDPETGLLVLICGEFLCGNHQRNTEDREVDTYWTRAKYAEWMEYLEQHPELVAQ